MSETTPVINKPESGEEYGWVDCPTCGLGNQKFKSEAGQEACCRWCRKKFIVNPHELKESIRQKKQAQKAHEGKP